MLTFATINDFKEYSGLNEVQENTQFLLNRANELVFFRIEQNLNQKLERHIEAAKKAVCAQVMFWTSANVSPVDVATSSGFSLGDLSMNESSAGSTSPTKLCPLSLAYLRNEGLTYKGLYNTCLGQEV